MRSFLSFVTLVTLAVVGRAAPADDMSARSVEHRDLQFPFIGCFVDESSSRLLNEAKWSSDDMTAVKCAAYCFSKNYPVAGVEYGRECYCDYALQGVATQVSQSECNMPCPGWSLIPQKCGGPNRIRVLSTTIFPPRNKPKVNGYKYLGCYTDSVHSRTLPDGAAGEFSDTMTVEKCVDACKARGKAYAGLEFSRECFCGDALNPAAITRPEEECHKTCNGDRKEFCGGPDRITIYKA